MPNLLPSDQSLFVNPGYLEQDFLPRLLPYREGQHKYIAECIKPLLDGRNGTNLLITGSPGIGKTACVKHVFRALRDQTDAVLPIYVNCWKRDTTPKIANHMADLVEISPRLREKAGSDEIFDMVIKKLRGYKGVIFCFDEIDRSQDQTFLYRIVEDVPFKAMLMVTNLADWSASLDQRLLSRLMAEKLEFKPYNLSETTGILLERKECAFVPGCWDRNAFDSVVKRAAEAKDVRVGLFLLKSAGLAAEGRASTRVELRDAQKAMEKLSDFRSSKGLQGFVSE